MGPRPHGQSQTVNRHQILPRRPPPSSPLPSTQHLSEEIKVNTTVTKSRLKYLPAWRRAEGAWHGGLAYLQGCFQGEKAKQGNPSSETQGLGAPPSRQLSQAKAGAPGEMPPEPVEKADRPRSRGVTQPAGLGAQAVGQRRRPKFKAFLPSPH